VLGTGWTEVVALVAAYGIAALATPAGISGAVLAPHRTARPQSPVAAW